MHLPLPDLLFMNLEDSLAVRIGKLSQHMDLAADPDHQNRSTVRS